MKRVHPGSEGASVWDQVWTEDPYANQAERMLRADRRLTEFGLTKALPAPSKTLLLDVGCGSGENLLLLKRRHSGITAIGTDLSSRALSLAAVRLGREASFCCADATCLPFETGSFTHLTAFGVLEHIGRLVEAVSELMRVLRPGGHFYLTTSNRLSLLQIINSGRRVLGLYPYGLQYNLTMAEIKRMLNPWAEFETLRVVQADRDMPLVRIADTALHKFNWGRYIYAHCVRRF